MRPGRELVWLTEIVSPYRIPVFNALARRLGDGFGVFFFGLTEGRRSWRVSLEDIRFRYEILAGVRLQLPHSTPYFVNPGIWRALGRHRPRNLVIGGYHHPTSLLGLLHARRSGCRALLWCESTRHDRRSGGWHRESYKRWFIRRCDGCIVPGSAAKEYLLDYGVPPDRIFRVPNVVDNGFFRQGLARWAAGGDRAGRRDKTVLYVGRVVEEKGVGDLIRACEILASRRPVRLLIVGDGRDRARYERYCRRKRLSGVEFVGFVQQEGLASYYGRADVCVLPTHNDAWGLVMNEAMACGLPVICSDAAGARELVADGRNGYVFPRGDVQGLVTCLDLVLGDQARAAAMGRQSAAIIDDGYTPSCCADAIVRAVASG